MRIAVLAALLVLSGCAMSPEQKRIAGIAAGVLIVGAVIAHQEDNGKAPGIAISDPTLPCSPQPDGSCR